MRDLGPRRCPACCYDIETMFDERIYTCPECGGAITIETCVLSPRGTNRRDVALLMCAAAVLGALSAVLAHQFRVPPAIVPGNPFPSFIPGRTPWWALGLSFLAALATLSGLCALVKSRARRRVGTIHARHIERWCYPCGFVILLLVRTMTRSLL